MIEAGVEALTSFPRALWEESAVVEDVFRAMIQRLK
jgi:hypothetical protein